MKKHPGHKAGNKARAKYHKSLRKSFGKYMINVDPEAWATMKYISEDELIMVGGPLRWGYGCIVVLRNTGGTDVITHPGYYRVNRHIIDGRYVYITPCANGMKDPIRDNIDKSCILCEWRRYEKEKKKASQAEYMKKCEAAIEAKRAKKLAEEEAARQRRRRMEAIDKMMSSQEDADAFFQTIAIMGAIPR
jgi:hypothetical protein